VFHRMDRGTPGSRDGGSTSFEPTLGPLEGLGPIHVDEAPPSSLSPRAYRLTGLRPSSAPPPPEEDLLRTLADVLLAAAHADGEICARERRTAARLLTELVGGVKLPRWLEDHLEKFDPDTFDLVAATEQLRRLPPLQRRHVAELVRAVCDANNAFDLEEERFLVGLVLALSLAPEDVADLVVHAAQGVDGRPKRIFDVLFAGAALAAGWPLGLAIAVAIRLDSPGPIFFKQRRYGQDGQEILVWKFRTMSVTEDTGEVAQARRNDPRVTRIGAFLRRTSLDELPQFINVLLGDMSVVGPRPHAVAHNQQYRTQILEYMLRHKVKPGITGWAQVNGWRGETDTLEKMVQRVAHDIEYIRRYSLLFDAKIVMLTAFGGLARRNAY
jgi:lipopolysaccharide/colanic/teichoic acid biosynthesis glycosyltransferase